ncbi:hypothetical protein O4J56_17900 [Nocardiopsis sp. RSe5-2]|uniref:Uncharacterized protein n=1 Tax=Nocardiopsis endophytica TaxID=3018445 RepID=A0ABT4U6E3_9ACTN|nr:hypothetical protein [Nocardiopsis endophytica]MDA2812522.1 hypothetical protein [Nocardiopsis endophytica]
MRAHRFQDWLLGLINQDGDPAITQAATFEQSGYTDRPFGIVLSLTSGGQVYLQVVRGSAGDGSDKLDEEPIVEGEPPAAVAAHPIGGGGQIRSADVEGYLAALVTNAGSREVSGVERFSERTTKAYSDPQRFGVKVFFHSKAAISLLFVHTLRSGDQPSAGNAFKVLEAV